MFLRFIWRTYVSLNRNWIKWALTGIHGILHLSILHSSACIFDGILVLIISMLAYHMLKYSLKKYTLYACANFSDCGYFNNDISGLCHHFMSYCIFQSHDFLLSIALASYIKITELQEVQYSIGARSPSISLSPCLVRITSHNSFYYRPHLAVGKVSWDVGESWRVTQAEGPTPISVHVQICVTSHCVLPGLTSFSPAFNVRNRHGNPTRLSAPKDTNWFSQAHRNHDPPSAFTLFSLNL